MIRRALVLLLALALAACGGGGGGGDGDASDDPVVEEPSGGGERRVQFTSAGKARISGTFTAPATAAKVPGVLFLPDLLVTDRDGTSGAGTAYDRMGADLAKSLTNAGVATLRYDRRGTGESRLEPDQRLSFDDLVADAKAGLDVLSERRETAGSKLALVAYDEGALVALRLAAGDNRISRVVLVSAPGRPLVDVQADDFAAIYGPEAATALRQTVAGIVASGTVPPLQELRAEQRPLLPQGEGPFLADLYRIDPVVDAGRTKVPVLVVVGSRAVAPGQPDAERLLAAVAPRGETLVADNADATLLNVLAPPKDDPSDPTSPTHDHGAPPPGTTGTRNTPAFDRITSWLATQP